MCLPIHARLWTSVDVVATLLLRRRDGGGTGVGDGDADDAHRQHDDAQRGQLEATFVVTVMTFATKWNNVQEVATIITAMMRVLRLRSATLARVLTGKENRAATRGIAYCKMSIVLCGVVTWAAWNNKEILGRSGYHYALTLSGDWGIRY